MKHVALYTLAFLIFGFIACNDDQPIKPSYRNTFIDDSVLQLYVPKSILDSNKIGQQIFGRHGYALLEHYGYWYVSKAFRRNDIKILYYDGLQKDSITDTYLEELIATKIWHLKKNSREGTFVSLDTMRVNGRKMAILKDVEECGDSALLVTSCFLAYPERSRVYRILITCDRSETGYMLRDSTPAIIQSISFKD